MEREIKKGMGGSPQLLDLIRNGRDWTVEQPSGREKSKFAGFVEERKLELSLGLPGGEGWKEAAKAKKKNSGESILSLGYSPMVTNSEGKASGSGPPVAHATTAGKAGAPNTSSSQPRAAQARVVGWPPIRSFRRNLASCSKLSLEMQNGRSQTDAKSTEDGKKAFFVKINMDGIPIGRKIDLKAYDSYGKLALAVDELFCGLLAAQKDPVVVGTKYGAKEKEAITGLLDGSGEYTLVYEDHEGDKILVGDVPWDMFVSSVKRLRVLKTADLSTSLITVSRKRTAAEC